MCRRQDSSSDEGEEVSSKGREVGKGGGGSGAKGGGVGKGGRVADNQRYLLYSLPFNAHYHLYHK